MLGKLINEAGSLALDLAVRDAEARKALKMGWAAATAVADATTGSPASAVVTSIDMVQTAIDDPVAREVVGAANTVLDTAVTGGAQAVHQAAAQGANAGAAASSAASTWTTMIDAGVDQLVGVGLGTAAGGAVTASTGDTAWLKDGAHFGRGLHRNGDWRASAEKLASAASGTAVGALVTQDQSEAVQQQAARFGLRAGTSTGPTLAHGSTSDWASTAAEAAAVTASIAGAEGPRERLARMEAASSAVRGMRTLGQRMTAPPPSGNTSSRRDDYARHAQTATLFAAQSVSTTADLTEGLNAARHADAASGERDDQLGEEITLGADRRMRRHQARVQRLQTVADLLRTIGPLTEAARRPRRTREG